MIEQRGNLTPAEALAHTQQRVLGLLIIAAAATETSPVATQYPWDGINDQNVTPVEGFGNPQSYGFDV